MLTPKQIKEFRAYLKKAENPIFFFDDDPDGLASALVLYKKYQRGHLIPVKIPYHQYDLYLNKIKELSPDIVFILDRAVVPQEMIDQVNVPIIWLDHHEPLERHGVHYYNPLLQPKKDNKCTTYWAYKIAGAKKTMWIAMVGIFADWMVPEFLNQFTYKKLLNSQKTAPAIMFDSEYGKIIRMFSYALKGEMKDVKINLEYLKAVKTPEELLHQTTPAGKHLHSHFLKFHGEYEELLHQAQKEAQEQKKENMFVFVYPSIKNSFTGELSNELLYRLKKSFIVVGRQKNDDVRLSLRGKKKPILPALKKALEKVQGYGGGHPLACGASVKKEDFPTFIRALGKHLSERKK